MITVMEQETIEAPRVIARQLQENQAVWTAICQRLRQANVPFAMTVARGSSDHAATFAKYLLEVYLGWSTASAAPSVCTLYQQQLQLKGALVLALSQSGQSPDICEVLASAKKAGAVTVALVNQVNSPLADIAEYVVPLWAGNERAVAATKSYLATLAALIQLVATYLQSPALLDCVQRLPLGLQAALEMDWSAWISAWREQNDALIIGRGFGYPIAQEAALKLKETAALHAEAFSSAEVLHGPVGMVRPKYPVLMFSQCDPTLPGTLEMVERLLQMQCQPWLALPANLSLELSEKVSRLPLPPSIHPLADPLMSIQAFYRAAAQLAVTRGNNPDHPDHLQKVTQTR